VEAGGSEGIYRGEGIEMKRGRIERAAEVVGAYNRGEATGVEVLRALEFEDPEGPMRRAREEARPKTKAEMRRRLERLGLMPKRKRV